MLAKPDVKRKILFILPTFKMGGAERQAFLLARMLYEMDLATSEFWAFTGPGPISDLCNKYNFPWKSIPNPRAGTLIQNIFRQAKFCSSLILKDCDMILPFTLVPNIMAGLFWRFSKARVCIWNQRDTLGGHSCTDRVEKLAASFIPVFVSNSTHGKRYIHDRFNVALKNIHVIPNGIEIVNPINSPDHWRSMIRADESTFVVTMVANLSRYKDHKTLLYAWAQFAERVHNFDNIKLILVGRLDEEYENLSALARQLSICSSIHFLGPIDDVYGFLHICDLAILCSKNEGCPNAILEYMAAGLPVIGTDTPGIREAMGETNINYLFKSGNCDELSDRIYHFYKNIELRKSVGANNKKRVEQKFSPSKMTETTWSIASNFF